MRKRGGQSVYGYGNLGDLTRSSGLHDDIAPTGGQFTRRLRGVAQRASQPGGDDQTQRYGDAYRDQQCPQHPVNCLVSDRERVGPSLHEHNRPASSTARLDQRDLAGDATTLR